MKDNIGNEVHIGDRVFCFTGKHKNTIQVVEKLIVAKDDFGSQIRAYFKNASWLNIYNLITMNALGIEAIKTIAVTGCDALGNPLQQGDKVLFLHPMEFYAEIGIVKKLAAKSCLLSIREKRLGQTEYRKKYEELVSLTAIDKENLIIHHCHD